MQPLPELPWILAGPLMSIYAPESVATYGAKHGEHAVSTGPYKVTLFLANKTLLLQRRPDYREDRYPTDGRPTDERAGYLKDAGALLPLHAQVEVKAYDAPLRTWTAFQEGMADCAEVARDAFAVVVDPATGHKLPWVTARKIELHRNPKPEIHYDAFNMEDPVVGHAAGAKGRAIRRAISLATDDVWAIQQLYTHKAERVFGPLLPEFQGYDYEFRNDWLPRDGEDRAELVEAAKDELAAAGLEGGKGVPVLKMHIPEGESPKIVFARYQRQLAEIGLRVESVPVSWAKMQEVLRSKGAQMWTSIWLADYPDAQNFLMLYYSGNSPEPNYTNYRNKEFDELYREARLLAPGQERDDLYREMQRIVTDDCPWRYKFRLIRWSATHEWLRGYRFNDIVPKFFKYCRPDAAQRTKAMASWK